jgi:Kelch motif
MRTSPLPPSKVSIKRTGLVLSFLFVAMSPFAAGVPLAAGAERSASKAPPITDTLRIYDTSGKTQTNRPVSVARAFRYAEIPQFAQASINGNTVLTQCDVKNRWADGSLKFAIVSFVVPNLAGKGSVVVSFSNQVSGNNTGYAAKDDLLNPEYDFDATTEMKSDSTQTVSAREMIGKGAFRYWLQGPIVTAVIVEDRTTARSFDKDFGDGSKALHPIFEAWFYPASKKVFVGYTVENIWASSDASRSMRDLSYALTLRAGAAAPKVRFSEPAFIHIGRTRWHKRYWIGDDPASIRVDHNFAYWTSTHAIANWDMSIRVTSALVASRTGTDSAVDRIEGTAKGIGLFQKDLIQGGASDWIGLAPLWDILYLYSMDERSLRNSLGNADLAGRIPWNFREADANAGTGHFFDAAGKVDTFGRVISMNARKRVTLGDLPQTCEGGLGADEIKTGAIDGQGWATTRDHMPDVAYIPYLFSGQYYYLESLQLQAAYILGFKLGCTEEAYNRQGDEAFLHDTQVRGDAWSFRTLAYASFISPDGTPEKAYFEDKLLNNIAEWEGGHDIPLDAPSKGREWNFGHTRRHDNRGISPLGSWGDRGGEFVQAPIKPTAKGAASPWEENFLMSAFGLARQFGYPTAALLQFGAKRLINQVLNPATFPEYMEAYRYPTINAAGQWISTWQESNSYFTYTPKHDEWKAQENIDHSYGFIAMAALSHMVTFSVDGYSGQAAWDYMRAHKPGRDHFATDSPKWAIVPLDQQPAATPAAFVPEVSEPAEPAAKAAAPETHGQDERAAASRAVAAPATVDSAAKGAPAQMTVKSANGKIPDAPGWYEIPNTKLGSVCPPNTPQYPFSSTCMNIIAAWSGGIADQSRNRMIIWGGGHNDYFGNELYALDLNQLSMTRLNDPSPLYPGPPPLPCKPMMPDGKPNTRHTYGGLTYVPHADRMYVFGGIVACTNGGGSDDTWTLDLNTLKWTSMDPHKGPQPRTIIGVVMSDYDPNTKLVFMENQRDFYSYNYDKNTYSRLQFDQRDVSYHMSAVIDPQRKLFIMFGGEWDGNGGVKVISIGSHSNYQVQDWNAQVKGCEPLRNSPYPGLAYDPVQHVIVGWSGGSNVYLFNPDTKTCTPVTYPNGPGAAQRNGTHGRFRYFAKLDIFALVNDVGQDAFVLRLRPSPGSEHGSAK